MLLSFPRAPWHLVSFFSRAVPGDEYAELPWVHASGREGVILDLFACSYSHVPQLQLSKLCRIFREQKNTYPKLNS